MMVQLNLVMTKKGEYLEFFVKDTGIRHSREYRRNLFLRDSGRVLNHMTEDYEGSGLGLSIFKMLYRNALWEDMGGK